MSSTGLAADVRVRRHEVAPGEPEVPARFTAIVNHLKSNGIIDRLVSIEPRGATDDELALVHAREYISLVEREITEGRRQLSTGDTTISVHSAEAARFAAGSALSSIDAVFSGQVQNAFCVTRPPGHHAGRARGMGFCLFNTVAIAARYAQRKHGAERVLIADWDVHHGNGTQDIFYSDGSVLFFSTHQSPWYPGTGAADETGVGAGAGKTINCPLPAGSGSSKILGAFRELLLPSAAEFRPDLILISAGFDSRVGDPLGQFLLRDEDFHQLTTMLADLAAAHCRGRLVSVLEGGYNLEGLALAAGSHIRALLGAGVNEIYAGIAQSR